MTGAWAEAALGPFQISQAPSDMLRPTPAFELIRSEMYLRYHPACSVPELDMAAQ